MTSVVAIITYKRRAKVTALVDSIIANCPGVKIAVFEDCGNDGTVEALSRGAESKPYDEELDVSVWAHPRGYELYAGHQNLGVTAQSNRAIKWFERSGADHLCLCNDDVTATGDFVREYACAHTTVGNHLWTFCDFTGDDYAALTTPFRGFDIKLQPRMTGMMMSMTKTLVTAIGYFDQTWNSKWGQEHCDFNNRAYFTGLVQVNGQAMRSLDIVSRHLKSVDGPSTITKEERPALDKAGEESINRASADYEWFAHYRPFGLAWPRIAGGVAGVETELLARCGYAPVKDWAPPLS